MTSSHQFKEFLNTFVPAVAAKSRQANKAVWILETTGAADAADLKAELDTALRMLFNDRKTYEKLLAWDREPLDPLLKRQLNVLIRTFKQNMIPQPLLEEIAQKEAALSQVYATYRPEIKGKKVSENEIRELLKNENDVAARKLAWEASKEIGSILAPRILELVALRNKAAQSLGYCDYFTMQLDLQEVDANWLQATLDDCACSSAPAYREVMKEVQQQLSHRFHVPAEQLGPQIGPWAWSEPFCQEDPLDCQELDTLVDHIDIPAVSRGFYQKMGIEVHPILERSDMFERPGKNQHAFCINIDRSGDVRTLNNVKSSIKWLETVLHELGHAIYDVGYDPQLPWLLKEPPHMITTEAMALIAGRQAYRYASLKHLLNAPEKEPLMKKAEVSLKRRQLIFSRWVLVMTAFERELYKEPAQDLNTLWWGLVEKYQQIPAPQGRQGKNDWAAKYHIGLAPVYYFSYLLGEMFASDIENALLKATGSVEISTPQAGEFLHKKLFIPGNRMSWSALVEHVSGKPLCPKAWVSQFS